MREDHVRSRITLLAAAASVFGCVAAAGGGRFEDLADAQKNKFIASPLSKEQIAETIQIPRPLK